MCRGFSFIVILIASCLCCQSQLEQFVHSAFANAAPSASGPVLINSSMTNFLVQHNMMNTASQFGIPQTNLAFYYFPNPTLAHNTVVAMGQWGVNNTNVTATLYSNGVPMTVMSQVGTYWDAADSDMGAVFAVTNVMSGLTAVVLSNSVSGGLPAYWTLDISEWANVAGVDGFTYTNGTGTNVQCAPISPSMANDLIVQYVQNESKSTPSSMSWLHGNQSGMNWSLLPAGADLLYGQAVQEGFCSNSSAIGPIMYMQPSAKYLSMAVALKTGTVGTMYTGERVIGLLHIDCQGNNAAGVYSNLIQFPCVGNCQAIGYVAFHQQLTNVLGENWKESPLGPCSYSNAYWNYFWLNTNNSNPNQTNTLTLQYDSNPNPSTSTALIYDIVGASAQPYDSGVTNSGTNGTALVNAQFNSFSLTPSQTNELTLWQLGEDWDSGTNVVSGQVFNAGWLNFVQPGGDTMQFDENNCWADGISSNTAAWPCIWTFWTFGFPYIGNWAGEAISLSHPGGNVIPVFYRAFSNYVSTTSSSISSGMMANGGNAPMFVADVAWYGNVWPVSVTNTELVAGTPIVTNFWYSDGNARDVAYYWPNSPMTNINVVFSGSISEMSLICNEITNTPATAPYIGAFATNNVFSSSANLTRTNRVSSSNIHLVLTFSTEAITTGNPAPSFTGSAPATAITGYIGNATQHYEASTWQPGTSTVTNIISWSDTTSFFDMNSVDIY